MTQDTRAATIPCVLKEMAAFELAGCPSMPGSSVSQSRVVGGPVSGSRLAACLASNAHFGPSRRAAWLSHSRPWSSARPAAGYPTRPFARLATRRAAAPICVVCVGKRLVVCGFGVKKRLGC